MLRPRLLFWRKYTCLTLFGCQKTHFFESLYPFLQERKFSLVNTPYVIQKNIRLTKGEVELFDFLVYVGRLYTPDTTLRVAGGWVRDKLLGQDSDDIDIVLDNVTGTTFAEYITAFQSSRRLEKSSVGIVKANSDKSKHLEVATAKVLGHEVDFVHLRAEEYTEDSRIPTLKWAKPLEDASRRDITINALFYNIHTKQVEDFTKKGLEDLKNQIIRTPLDPYQTFLDDPLRVLRAIRFSCEYGFKLDSKLVEAIQRHKEIKQAMQVKVSRERIGIEVRKMFSGKNPTRALRLLIDLDLMDIVFDHEKKNEDIVKGVGERRSSIRGPWSNIQEEQALKRLNFLQQSCIKMDEPNISCIEAMGAILSSFGKQEVSQSGTTLPTVPSSGSIPKKLLQDIQDDLLIESSLAFLKHHEQVLDQLPTDDIVDMLKVHLRWSRATALSVLKILSAVMSFPEEFHVTSAQVQLFLWYRRYHQVANVALSILYSEVSSNNPYHDLNDMISFLSTHFPMEQMNQKPRMIGNQVKNELGGNNAGRKISKAMEILAVWEFFFADKKTLEQESNFLEKLRPNL